MRHRATSDAAGDRENEAGTQGTTKGTAQGTGPRSRRLFPLSRRGLIGAVVAGALVAGGGLTASAFLGGGHRIAAGEKLPPPSPVFPRYIEGDARAAQ